MYICMYIYETKAWECKYLFDDDECTTELKNVFISENCQNVVVITSRT